MEATATSVEVHTVLHNGKKYMVVPGLYTMKSAAAVYKGFWPVKTGEYAECAKFAAAHRAK